MQAIGIEETIWTSINRLPELISNNSTVSAFPNMPPSSGIGFDGGAGQAAAPTGNSSSESIGVVFEGGAVPAADGPILPPPVEIGQRFANPFRNLIPVVVFLLCTLGSLKKETTDSITTYSLSVSVKNLTFALSVSGKVKTPEDAMESFFLGNKTDPFSGWGNSSASPSYSDSDLEGFHEILQDVSDLLSEWLFGGGLGFIKGADALILHGGPSNPLDPWHPSMQEIPVNGSEIAVLGYGEPVRDVARTLIWR